MRKEDFEFKGEGGGAYTYARLSILCYALFIRMPHCCNNLRQAPLEF